MGRKIALVGALLVASGIAVLTAFVVPPLTAPVTPMSRGATSLLGFVPMVASLVLTAGAAMLALGVLVALTGRLPVLGPHRSLLLCGIGAWVLAVLVETVLVPGTMIGATSTGSMRAALVLSQVSVVLQLGAGVLLALWGVGLLAPETGLGQLADRPVEDELRA
ncbi:hypothetical protein [Ornithinimicrobium avium]|uniref:Uncharacterized protein n=1 Tax=Ornithinimicrobium avium TaxID=2283195 RepID=A0A345NKY5_9MICO|nr:hypothetical protein [Ornithinimicrobium avium]AXH95693.1 hypothetical protein DV701_05765 [Ornithinimicrobium avium]